MTFAIEWVESTAPLSSLRPYERNPRKISKEAFARLKKSIQDNGYHQRIICTPDLKVIGGHMRIRALQELGVTQVPVLIASRELTEPEYQRILIQDNVAFGVFDTDILASDFEFDALIEWGVPEDLMIGKRAGFDDAKADEVPEEGTTPISRPGDLWNLGAHRVLCGDATKAEDYQKLFGTARSNLMITDPPYGVEYDPAWRGEAHTGSGDRLSLGVHAKGKVENDHRADWRQAFAHFTGNIAYVWCASLTNDVAIAALESVGFERRALIIWAKNNFAISRSDYHWQHEPCWYAVRNKGDWHGDRKQTTVWNIDKPQKSETGHSTQKPVECMRRPILNNSLGGGIVYDPFLGSGTTIIAAEQTSRICYGLEIVPLYVDLICWRFEKFTGTPAMLDGKPFAEVEAERIKNQSPNPT